MRSLKGTWPLIRLALRRDRIKLTLWVIAIATIFATQVPAVISFYGSDQADQLVYAQTTAPSVAGRIFAGPIHGPETGSIIMNELFLFTAIAIAFMSTLTIVRHTRQNEETGRSELIGSAVVGHHASLTAALVVTVVANIILGGLICLVLWSNDLALAGSIGTGAAMAAIGIVFTGIATITAQLASTARGANSLAAIVIGAAFLLRGAGDALGQVVRDGTGVISAWPSWLSPIGWGQQIYPFSENNWWIFWLFGGFFAILTATTYLINAHRDLGLGMLPDKPGPAHAKSSLLSPVGLAWRLQHSTLIGWTVATAVMGGVIGLISSEFKDLIESNPDIEEYFGSAQGDANFTDFFFAAMLGLIAIALAGYVVQSLLRMRSEESLGRLEPVLATHVSRSKWMMSHTAVTLMGVVILLIVLGLSSGIGFVAVTGAEWSEVLRITQATLVYLPALAIFIGTVLALIGLLPRLAIAVSWAVFALTYLMAQFGQILKLPQTVLDISPFTHIPAVPLETITWRPIVSLTAIALGLAVVGFASLRNRDITTS